MRMNEMIKVVARRTGFFPFQYSKNFVAAFLLVSFAAILRIWPLNAIGDEITWFTFYPAVIVAILYGGISAGLIAILLSCLTVVFLWPLLAAQPLINNLFDL